MPEVLLELYKNIRLPSVKKKTHTEHFEDS